MYIPCARCGKEKVVNPDYLCVPCFFLEVERYGVWVGEGCTVPQRELDDAVNFENCP